jgi:filamentous hemagglutinin
VKPIVPPRLVPPAKLTDYLLKPDHPVGSSKAAFFKAFGFTLDRLDVMVEALVDHADRNPTAHVEDTAWGVKYTVRCRLRTPDGRDPCILTIWIVPPGERAARLVTAYPNEA